MANRKLCGVYVIRNIVSGRAYVGSAQVIGRRWRAHRHLLATGRHHSPTLQRSWDKHGAEAFVFEILELVDGDEERLLAREQHWIEMFQAAHPQLGYNVGAVAGSRLGVPQSAEARALMSAQRLGVPKTLEHKAKIGAAKVGQKKSPEHRAKIAGSVAETMKDQDRRERSAAGGRMSGGCMKGKNLSDVARANMSASAKTLLADPVAKAARLANLNGSKGGRKPGFTQSPETRAKMAAAHKARLADPVAKTAFLASIRGGVGPGRKKGSKMSDETRAKMSAAHKSRWAARRAEGSI